MSVARPTPRPTNGLIARDAAVPNLAAGSNTAEPTLPTVEPANLRAAPLPNAEPIKRLPRTISTAVSGNVVHTAFLSASSYAYFACSQVPPESKTSSSA